MDHRSIEENLLNAMLKPFGTCSRKTESKSVGIIVKGLIMQKGVRLFAQLG
jgi:hypothetical protein